MPLKKILMTEDSNKEEQAHFNKVIKAFKQYKRYSSSLLLEKMRAAKNIKNQEFQNMVQKRLYQHVNLIDANFKLLNLIIENDPVFLKPQIDKNENYSTEDQDKVRSTLKQFVRDWSDEGKKERTETYGPIYDELNALYGLLDVKDRGKIKVLVPGAGLGRLAMEICKLGFTCQGNEFSFFMLLASNFILNNVSTVNSLSFYPWIHQHSNMPSESVQMRQVFIPDVVPGHGIPKTADFSMVAGDFIEVYSEKEQENSWDVIITCFFIDTAKDLTSYLDTIRYCLKPNGKWINLGPLLWHFEGKTGAIEFTLEEVMIMVKSYGFEINSLKVVDTTYAACPETMMDYLYRNRFFTATKI